MSVQKVGSSWVVRAYSGIDLNTVTNLAVEYEDPNGGRGTLETTIFDTQFADGDFTHLIGTIAGIWKFEITGEIAGKPIISFETGKVKLKVRFD